MARRFLHHTPSPAPSVALRVAVTVLALLLPSLLVAWESDAPASFAVVVHSENPVRQLDTETLGRIYLGKTQLWEGGEPIEPINLPKSDQLRHDFAERILGRSVASVESYWQRQVFSGRSDPPLEMACCNPLLDWLVRTPGSIAYLPTDTRLPAELKAIPVVDDAGHVVVDHPRFGIGSQHDVLDHSQNARVFEPYERRVIQSQGSVVLIEMGVCGAAEEGRLIALANQDPTQPRRISLQTTQQSGGRTWSNIDPQDIPAGAQSLLGCTVDDHGGWIEYRLAGVADVSLPDSVSSHQPVAVAERIRVVAGARCGRDGEGSVLSLINEHPQRGARVRVQHLDTQHGGSSRQYVRTYVLGAGDSRELGCNLDGAMRREVSLLEIRQD